MRPTTEDRVKQVIALTAEGYSAATIAARLGVTQRTVVRLRRRAQIAQAKAPELTPEQRDRIAVLIREGMPATWIAEDVGCARGTITRHALVGATSSSEWRQVWNRIRRNDALLQLHREFAPKSTAAQKEAA